MISTESGDWKAVDAASYFPCPYSSPTHIMAKKKNKQVCWLNCYRGQNILNYFSQLIRPWCWYCEREFEDEKGSCSVEKTESLRSSIATVLMQHQKAKHFKCGMCPRRLNTAGGLAVHIQQVHKLEPEKYVFPRFPGSSNQTLHSLPRIENALPGRDGYEVEIFGMEGIPAPDIADFKRRKEIELGLAAGSISQPQAKRPKIDNRVIPGEELRRQLQEHKALMGLNNPEPSATQESTSAPAVYGAPQTYAAPPVPLAPGMPPTMPPGTFPPSVPPGFPPPFAPGMPAGYVRFYQTRKGDF
jgi:hypothetical protein